MRIDTVCQAWHYGTVAWVGKADPGLQSRRRRQWWTPARRLTMTRQTRVDTLLRCTSHIDYLTSTYDTYITMYLYTASRHKTTQYIYYNTAWSSLSCSHGTWLTASWPITTSDAQTVHGLMTVIIDKLKPRIIYLSRDDLQNHSNVRPCGVNIFTTRRLPRQLGRRQLNSACIFYGLWDKTYFDFRSLCRTRTFLAS